MPKKQYYVYILASKSNGTLYIGVTSELAKRVYQHKNDPVGGFARKYQVHNLVPDLVGDYRWRECRHNQG